jgi:hypothetical protein
VSPDPNSSNKVVSASTGDDCDNVKRKSNRVSFGFVDDGNAKPGVEDPSIVPRSIGTVVFPTAAVALAPVNVNVAVPIPSPIVIELVPPPEHIVAPRQTKKP